MEKNVSYSTAEDLSALLRAKFGHQVNAVILFGSRARGDSQEWSDYDLIVLVDKKTPELRETISETAWEFGFSRNVTISILVFEKERFDCDKYEPLFMNVRKEGVRV
ncbi:MAG: nucleotidyltransferase [Dehalococcoidia bacterium]|nr:nucleotidyltransferase [Dehalococcoidia bacterium]MBF8304786.1 nucleotidyltransferase [Dehalococcoidia bacterium]